MLPLMEMLMQAGNGKSLEQMSSQFNLTRQQTEKAMEALMPAFREGLRRNAADPMGFAGFMQALADGHHAKYFEQPEKAMSNEGIAEGNAILGHLFGSRELSRAVAAQAAQASGLSQNILKQMLPALAPMILGGLFKQMNGQMNGGTGGSGRASADSNPWGDLLGQMMGGGKGGANPWGDILEQMMGGGTGTPGPGLPGGRDNPLGRIFDDMVKSGRVGDPRTAERDPYTNPEPREPDGKRGKPSFPGGSGGGLGDLFGEMFETGRKTQRDYQRGMETIFDQFLDGMKRR